MKKSNVIFLSISILVISILIAILTNCKPNDIILSAATLIAAFAGLATLIVALALYNRFKIDQNIIDKQGERVVELLVILRKILFYLHIDGKYMKKGQGFTFRIWVNQIGIKDRRDFVEIVVKENTISDLVLLFNENYIDSVGRIENMFSDIYTPIVITNKLKEYSIMASINEFEKSDQMSYGNVSPGRNFLPPDDTEEVLANEEDPEFTPIMSQNLASLTNRNYTLKMFLDQWVDIFNTVEDWLRTNAPAAAESMGISKK